MELALILCGFSLALSSFALAIAWFSFFANRVRSPERMTGRRFNNALDVINDITDSPELLQAMRERSGSKKTAKVRPYEPPDDPA